jgi:hypothetical protein
LRRRFRFLDPGQAPFDHDGFFANFSGAQQVRIRCISELEEPEGRTRPEVRLYNLRAPTQNPLDAR